MDANTKKSIPDQRSSDPRPELRVTVVTMPHGAQPVSSEASEVPERPESSPVSTHDERGVVCEPMC